MRGERAYHPSRTIADFSGLGQHFIYCIMHDSGPLGPSSLSYEYRVFELKHYLILNEGFGEMVHFFFIF